MYPARLLACTLFTLAMAGSAFAQAPVPAENTGEAGATSAPDGSTDDAQLQGATAVPQLPRVSPVPETNTLKLVAGDFKHFFRTDTLRTLSYAGIVAVSTAPWDREGVNNGFGIPTTLFESGNMIGNFVFQAGAGLATYGAGKAFGNQKLSLVGRDIVRAQVLSQVMVQTVKHSVRRNRPDLSNNKSFPSGHAASAFATASVLKSHYGWKVGAPAYALGSYVALARMAWNRHHATDVVMGAGFGLASARTVTMTLNKNRFSVGVQPQNGGASLNFTKIYK